MNQKLLLLYTGLALLVTISACCYAAQEESFKINKLNLIWTKAQHSLGSGKLKDLKKELLKHESDELSLKKLKAHNQDKDGLIEAAVRKKLLAIMKKYSLEKHFDGLHQTSTKTSNEQPLDEEGVRDETPATKSPAVFRDSKLDKLWKKAEKSGFTQEQLMILHEEFEHQQNKLDEHYDTMNMLKEEIESRSKKDDRLENTLESDPYPSYKKSKNFDKSKEKPNEKKVRLSENVNQDLIEKNSDLKKNYGMLQSKISSEKLDHLFDEYPINHLWAQAQKGNFSPEELESLKEELGHFETRLKKLQYFASELDNDNVLSSKKTSDLKDDAPFYKQTMKKVQELSNQVAKSLKSLEKKILKNPRTEL